MSKEEMILLAMEQSQKPYPGSQLAARPVVRPSSPLEESHQAAEEEEAEEAEVTADVRNADQFPVVNESTHSKTSSKGNSADSHNSDHQGKGRHKPRPYGMDKPSKSRPTLDSGMKDKNEQFGLPHYPAADFVQKDQYNAEGIPNVLGWQLPNIRWSAFSNIFQHFVGGSTHKKTGMGKSDAVEVDLEKCVDDEEKVEGLRFAPGICVANQAGKKDNCREACISTGFSGGKCLGPYPTPGCLCNMHNTKEYSK